MALERIAQGGTTTFIGEFITGAGDLVNPITPLVDIIDADGNQLVTDAVPVFVSLGVYSYTYMVPLAGPLGTWRIHWTGVIDGVDTGGDEWFLVVTPGSIVLADCNQSGPCTVWDLDLSGTLTPSGSLPNPCLLEGQPVPIDIINAAILAASQLLWALTGRQFSVCRTVIRPCRKGFCNDACCIPGVVDYGYPWMPVMQENGLWTNISCSCRDECSCTKLSEINLPDPVCTIEAVKIDGVIVDPTTYRVDNSRKLVRLGSDIWPRCNDLTKEDTEIGTWSVTLTFGRTPPQLVLLGAAEMAGEIIKHLVGKACKLPQHISSVTRQGISVSFLDEMQFLDRGLTGMYFVDLAARTFNPCRLARRPTVYSPDSANQWRVETWRSP